jgi:hypothetical protein
MKDPRLEDTGQNSFADVAERGMQALLDARDAANNDDETDEEQEQE